MTKTRKKQHTREANQILNVKFGMKQIAPITDNQDLLFEAYEEGKNILAIGSAGTGKTFTALYLALKDVMANNDYKEIIIVRSSVQSREQGHLPGDAKEKMAYFESPYADIVNELFGRGDAYEIMKQKNTIRFMSTSFIRGLTFDDALIIVDECQSCTYHELDSIITRVGEGSRIIFCGDVKQDDLKTGGRGRNDVSGLKDFVKVLNNMSSVQTIEFTINDVVRSGLVKEYLIAKEAA
jgi:phosphate starvation-inducible protein PhoH